MSNLDTKHLVYKPKNKVRFVTAASLFDGHDASINIMRRILQGTGCEVIHPGHNRSVKEVVDAALAGRCARHCALQLSGRARRIFLAHDRHAARGGRRSHQGIRRWRRGHRAGRDQGAACLRRVAHLSPEDGARLGLQGMINDMIAACDQNLAESR